MDARNPAVSSRIAWKTNDGGDIKAQDIVALAWIPLGLMTSVKDQTGGPWNRFPRKASIKTKGCA